jgi:electron transport complex protein RnfC
VQLFTPDAAPRLVLGRIGETIGEFCHRHHVDAGDRQVIVNGMLSGREATEVDARIESNTEAVTVRPRPDMEAASACLSCGWCVDVCPTSLRPIHLLQLAERLPDDDRFTPTRADREALHCVGCGLCSYVCPTRLPLMHEAQRLREAVVAADARLAAGTPRRTNLC